MALFLLSLMYFFRSLNFSIIVEQGNLSITRIKSEEVPGFIVLRNSVFKSQFISLFLIRLCIYLLSRSISLFSFFTFLLEFQTYKK